jgi:hypothetical protein
MTDNREELMALAERIEAAKNGFRLPASIDADVLSAFGLKQRWYERAGWKFICPDSDRPRSPLRPTLCVDDLLTIYQYAQWAKLPPLIPSDPCKATAFCLRALAETAR